MNKIIHLLIDDIIQFHKDLEASSVMKSGIHDLNLLESAVNTPFQTFGGEDLYPTIYDKAAQLCYGLAKNHAFTDGNKRIAFHSMQIYLALEEINLSYSDDEAEALIIGVADNSVSVSKLKEWLISHSV
ncbi:MAG: type II toxin-antitoxin system death-on-curing family toxin [Veillonella sp.]|uniref:type II toxin-antitoxin system death-on-curing family toxin n=1 Tax=Veillonella sp. TaxID=1926307 RepID=UPI0025E9D592|nr:type II toxin-antitoxin system death-on-curing family toxin [Veillonella sp.]MBS4913533.1 type II toxin-antitoxin system death-on-curing family toxin [Veillonella sp.]